MGVQPHVSWGARTLALGQNGRMSRARIRSLLAAGTLALGAGAAQALTFEFTFLSGTPTQAQNAFIQAGNLWSQAVTDNVTLRLTVGLGTLSGGSLAEAISGQNTFGYSTVLGALAGDVSSSTDALAVSNLPAGAFAMWINRTSENGNSATAYLDNDGSTNNTFVQMTTANAAALGLPFTRSSLGGLCSPACDGYIQFSNAQTYDFDRSNGITAGAFDFVGLAAHEIGHAMGFISGVDFLDQTPGLSADLYRATTLDLFRFSTASSAVGAIDFTASTASKYFTLSRASSGSVTFSTGVAFGDGRQASHWKDGLNLGLLDPTLNAGSVQSLSGNDLTAMDAIGWNLAAVPELPRHWQMAAGLAVVGIAWRRSRRRH